MSKFETSREQEPSFIMSCEYRSPGPNGDVVMKFGADLFGDPHIERTEIRDGQIEKVVARAYCYSEPAILMGILWHAAAGKDAQERSQLRDEILRQHSATSLREYGLSNAQTSFDDSSELRRKLSQEAEPKPGDVLGQVLLYGQGDYYLQLIHRTGGITFQEKSPIYGELAEDDDEDVPLPVVGHDIKPLFTLPDSELVQFAACFSKADRGRVDPDSLRLLVDGLLPGSQDS